MITKRTLLIAALVLAFTQPLFAGDTAGSAVIFTFSPPAETRYTQTVIITRQRQSVAGKQTEGLTLSSNVIIRQTAVGWEEEVQPREYALKLNGREVLDPFADLQSQLTLTHLLDREGRLIHVDIDYKPLFDMLSRDLPSRELAKLTPMIQRRGDELKQKAAAEWNARIGDFIGKSVKIGDSWQQEMSYPLPEGGSAGFTVKTEFAALERCGEGSCVRIRQSFASSPATSPGAPLMEGTLSRLIDPRTMLIHEENSDTSLRTNGALVDRETRVYEFTYGP